MNQTTILIDKTLRDKLKLLKITNRESYNEIIWRLVKPLKINKS